MSKVILVLLVLAAVAYAGKGKKGKERRHNSDYDAENVKDLPCNHEGLFELEKGIKPDFLKKQGEKGWVYLMGNRAHGRDITRTLTGEYPEGFCFFKDACMKNTRTSKGFTISGFSNKKAVFECKEVGKKKQRECKPSKESSHKKEAEDRGPDEAVAIWSDNKANALFVRCSGKGKNQYAVWSLRGSEHKDVDEATKEKVLKLISARGFNDEHTVIYPQKSCAKGGKKNKSGEDESTTENEDDGESTTHSADR